MRALKKRFLDGVSLCSLFLEIVTLAIYFKCYRGGDALIMLERDKSNLS